VQVNPQLFLYKHVMGNLKEQSEFAEKRLETEVSNNLKK